jgi:hypothetical protein
VLSELLVRSGVERLTVIDPDTVEPPNLSRSVYDGDDLGRPKVAALAERLRRINSAVQVDTLESTLAGVGLAKLRRLVGAADVVVGACDDPSAQASLNHLSYELGVPGVFVLLYRAAAGGELVWTLPDADTACYRCATAVRHSIAGGPPQTDYTTGRLAGEVALAADIANVTNAAAKATLALAALRRALPEEDVPKDGLSDFLLGPALDGKTFVMFANTPGFDFFPRVFQTTPNQHAWQTLWMRVERDPQCAVCGTERVPIGSTEVTVPDIRTADALVASAAEDGSPG